MLKPVPSVSLLDVKSETNKTSTAEEGDSSGKV